MKCTNKIETGVLVNEKPQFRECGTEVEKVGEVVVGITTYSTIPNYPGKDALYQCPMCKTIKLT